MRTVRYFFDLLIVLLMGFACYVYLSRTQLITSKTIFYREEYILTLTGNLIPVFVGAITTLFGILIAVYLLFAQMSGRPYSRFAPVFYEITDICYFGILFFSILIPVYVMAFWAHIAQLNKYYLLDVCLILFTASIFSLISVVLKFLSIILYPKLLADKVLKDFSIKNVLSYGLVLVTKDNENNKLQYQLKTWGHRHNLMDPLGAFHELIMETIKTKERITFHLYMSALMEKLALLNGVRFIRKFGLASGKKKRPLLSRMPVIFSTRNLEKKIQVVIHALHYLVRRAKHMTEEKEGWILDNHRQIFVINIADLISALSKRSDNALLIEICLYALLKICMDYRAIQPYGSYEPLKDLFCLAYDLERLKFVRESKICFQVLAFLDVNTHFISQNQNVDMKEIRRKLPRRLVEYYNKQKIYFKGKELQKVFKKSIWKS